MGWFRFQVRDLDPRADPNGDRAPRDLDHARHAPRDDGRHAARAAGRSPLVPQPRGVQDLDPRDHARPGTARRGGARANRRRRRRRSSARGRDAARRGGAEGSSGGGCVRGRAGERARGEDPAHARSAANSAEESPPARASSDLQRREREPRGLRRHDTSRRRAGPRRLPANGVVVVLTRAHAVDPPPTIHPADRARTTRSSTLRPART